MRTMILALAVVLLAAPAWATVFITATHLGGGVVEISYNATTETELVRAFALDITVTDGNIVDCNDYAIGDDSGGFGIFPGNFTYITVLGDGTVQTWEVDEYTPVADKADYPGDTQGGLGTNGITAEMGSLYEDPGNAPGQTGVLCTVTCDTTCLLSVTANAMRGKVVLEDATEAVLDLTGATDVPVMLDCFPSTFTTYGDWVLYGKPKCWCNSAIDPTATGDYQCDGDGDFATQGILKFRIYTNDLNLLIPNWKKKMGAADPCADYDHKDQGILKFRVYTNDLQKLIDNWKKKDADLGGDCGLPSRPE